MAIDFLLQRFEANRGAEALAWRGRGCTYGRLADRVGHWCEALAGEGIDAQSVVTLEGDYSPESVALLLALFRLGAVAIPLTEQSRPRIEEYRRIAQAGYAIRIDPDDQTRIDRLPGRARHDLYDQLRRDDHPGLLLFSSGSTGEPKAALHDVVRLLEKYKTPRHDLRTLAFLLFDHIGGIDTLLYCLGNTSCVVTVPDRSPDTICAAVQESSVEVLPVSPSFLNLLILGQAYKRYDLGSLKYITYGAEVMPETTLAACHRLFPNVRLLQKFGTTEVGTLRSSSRSSDSTWVKIGGEGYDVRVVEGILQIKTRSAILGYLNAPSPFTEDGWFVTGDLVEQDGEYLRILGRETEIINVGGEKVNPAEVENVILAMDTVKDVSVFGQANPILGNIVCAKVSAADPARLPTLVADIKTHCRDRLEPYKVPMKIEVVEEQLHSARFKKMRRRQTMGSE